MKKVFLSLVAAAAALCVTSCSGMKTESTMTYDELMEEKASAEKTFGAAQSEYQSLFSGSDSSRSAAANDDADFNNLCLEDQITLAAWNAYNTGDDSEVVSLLKENDLYDKCLDIIDKYNLDEEQEIISTPSSSVAGGSRAVNLTFMNSSTMVTGDIVLCYGGATSSSGSLLGLVIPGTWKHAGLIDRGAPAGWAVLSASNETNTYLADSDGVVGRVGWETADKWTKKDAVTALRVSNSTQSKRNAAVSYGRQFVGKPYNLAVGRDDNSSWYCSKVVYRSYKSQGFDLEYNTWYYIRGPWVTPQDLYDDSDTYYIGGDRS